MTNTHALAQYLYSHKIINEDSYNQLVASDAGAEDIRNSLISSGILSVDEVLKLESLLSALPHYPKKVPVVSAEVLALVPYELAQRYRTVCIAHSSAGFVLLTDQSNLEEELFALLDDTVEAVYRVSTQAVDSLLDQQAREVEESAREQIRQTARKVRTTDSYGSSAMAFFFPHDYKREIAEDISSLKLLQSIITLAQVKCAQRCTIRPSRDKLEVVLTIDGQEYPLVDLPKNIAFAVYLKLRYLADASLEQIEEPQTVVVAKLDRDKHNQQFQVRFVPQAYGITCMIEESGQHAGVLALSSAGFSLDDAAELIRAFARDRGMVLVSGLCKAGRSYAMYRLTEALGKIKRTLSLEDNIEHVTPLVDHKEYSKRPDKDVQLVDRYYDALVCMPLRLAQAPAVYNLACRMVVLAQAPEHVSAVIKRLLNRGIKTGSIARTLRYNVVTHRLARLNQEEGKGQYRKLDEHEIATLAEYVNYDYWCDYLYREGEESLPESWQSTRWRVAAQPHSRWFGFKSWVHQQIPATQDWVYLRALLPLGDVIEESQARTESFVEFEHTLKRAQKEAIALPALTAAYRGTVSVDEVLSLLRN